MFRLLPLLVLACLFAEIVSLDFRRIARSRRRFRQRFPPDRVTRHPQNVRQKEKPEFFQYCTFRSLEPAEQVWKRFEGVEDPYLFQDPVTRSFFAILKADQIATGNVSLPPDSLANAEMLPFVSLLGLVDPEKSRERTGKVDFGDGLLTILQRTFPVGKSLSNDQFDAMLEKLQQIYGEFPDRGSTTAYFLARNKIPAEFIYITNAKCQGEVVRFEQKLNGLLGGPGSSRLHSARVFRINPVTKHRPRFG